MFELVGRSGVLAGLGVAGALAATGVIGSGTASAAGSTPYVAQGGTNTGDCTSSAAPCATISYALDRMMASVRSS